jgi:hypothetical protein
MAKKTDKTSRIKKIVSERPGPEKAGVGGSTPSRGTTCFALQNPRELAHPSPTAGDRVKEARRWAGLSAPKGKERAHREQEFPLPLILANYLLFL